MNESKAVLRKVGWSLIVIGLIELLRMFYVVSNGEEYFSSLSGCAIALGIFLIRGNPILVIVLPSVCIFFTGFILLWPVGKFLILPIDLYFTYLYLFPMQAIGKAAFYLFLVCYPLWVFRNLTSDPISQFLDEKKIERASHERNSRNGFIAGCCVALTLSIVIALWIDDDNVEKAKAVAKNKLGEDYKFAVTGMSTLSEWGKKTQYNVTVAAYNEKQIQHVKVNWEE